MKLNDYLNQKNATSVFNASLSDITGNITFCSSGRRGTISEFTLGLDSFISILNDIYRNVDKFKSHERYNEDEWRDLGNQYFSNGPAKTMCGVQTKPLFSTISKIIAWANIPYLDSIDTDQFISLTADILNNAINQLEKESLTFKSKDNIIDIVKKDSVPVEVRVIYSYLVNSFSHRKIQKDILGKEAPNNGGGFLAMDILHNFEIRDDKKGILKIKTLEEEIKNASGKYLEALLLLKDYYLELLNETDMKDFDLKKYLLKFKNSTFDSIKSDYNKIFSEIFENEKELMSNIENKLGLIKNEPDRISVKDVIDKLKDVDYSFVSSDENNLATFSRVINSTINISNFVNNFTIERLRKDNITLSDLFNRIKISDNLVSFKAAINLTGTLNSIIPFYFSVIKHCQFPDLFPIYYKYWYSCLNNILDKGSDYDSLTNFYRSFPEESRSLNFCAFFGALGKAVLLEIKKDITIKSIESKEYKRIIKLIPSRLYIKEVFGLDGSNSVEYDSDQYDSVDFNYLEFYKDIVSENIHLRKSFVLRFISALITKPFVILTGLSGSGKTLLARAFAKWICDDESQYSFVSVGADWTSKDHLLGFPDGLNKEYYALPDNGTLDLIIIAGNNQDKPYFLILDEMNLSHVERYFADFLSLMEAKDEPIKLYKGELRVSSDGLNIPVSIDWPQNLFIIGTVNIDETTYMFSPKVLDRANVIEFRVTEKEMKTYLDINKNGDIKELVSKGKDMARDFLKLSKDPLSSEHSVLINRELILFFNELKKTGAEYGYRSASEILRFVAAMKKIASSELTNEVAVNEAADNEVSDNEAASNEAVINDAINSESVNDKSETNEVVNNNIIDILDAAIMQKLLPKLHGSRSKLVPVLIAIGSLCVNSGTDVKKDIFESKVTVNFEKDKRVKYRLSLEKLYRMYKNVHENGFTSYAEA